jgi:hypothetical protein
VVLSWPAFGGHGAAQTEFLYEGFGGRIVGLSIDDFQVSNRGPIFPRDGKPLPVPTTCLAPW